MPSKYRVNISKVLDGLPLEACCKPRKTAKPKSNRLPSMARVVYRRTNNKRAKLVRGFVHSTSWGSAVYILDLATGLIVAAPRSRVTLA